MTINEKKKYRLRAQGKNNPHTKIEIMDPFK